MRHINRWDKGIVSGYTAAEAKQDSQYSWYGMKPNGTLVLGFEEDHAFSDYIHYDPDTGEGYKGFKSEDWVLKERGSSSLGHYRKVKVDLSSVYYMKKSMQFLWIRGSRNSGDAEARKSGAISMYNPDQWFAITKYDWRANGELWVYFKRLDAKEHDD